MADHGSIKTYGNTELPEGTPDRPLVTFALFAYNQEKYIREAVEGAFSQSYSPLEIILSDDCSGDQTFEIIEEMSREYKGPHLIRIRKSKENLGTLNHILEVSHIASGEYIVVSAGDDISRSSRVCLTVDKMLAKNLDVASFACEEFINDTSVISGRRGAVHYINDNLIDKSPRLMQIHGASACYRSTFLRSLPYSKEKVLLEDYVFQIAAFWSDMKICSFDDVVLFYRIHSNNIGPKDISKIDNFEIYEVKIGRHYERIKIALNYLSHIYCIINQSNRNYNNINFKISENAKIYCSIRERWPKISLRERIWLIKASRRFGNPRRDFLRAFGRRFYFAIARLI